MNNEQSHIDPIALLPKILSGEATPSEKLIIEEWLAQSEENRKNYESFSRLWNLTAPFNEGEINIDDEWQRMEKAIEPVRKIGLKSYTFLKVAAIVILVSSLAFIGIRSLAFRTMKSSATEIAEYNLPDGTLVSLNAGSAITYRNGFGTTHRSLRLKGEGFFEVTKSALPFVVEAGDAEIRVTGTKFNIRSYRGKEDLRVTVTEGHVKLLHTENREIQIDLKAGETGIFSNGTVSRDTSADVNVLAWKTGIMEFNNASLQEVTKVLENTYHIPFSVDSAVMKCAITVRFENQEADSVFKVLRSTLDVNITRKGRRVLITGNGC